MQVLTVIDCPKFAGANSPIFKIASAEAPIAPVPNRTLYLHSRSQQRTDQSDLVLTLKFLALKKPGFSPVKNTSQNVLPLFFMQLFSADATISSKKN